MGMLIKGQWSYTDDDSVTTTQELEKSRSYLRNWITVDGRDLSPYPGFTAEAGRYHLYYSRACPFAQRAMIFRQLKGLENLISVSEVEPLMLDEGWTFSTDYPDHLYGIKALHEIYSKSGNDLTTRVTVPVLWDKQRQVIVSNDSAQIIRMFNSAFNQLTGNAEDYYPQPLRQEINQLNDWINPRITLGVYRAGFAKTQADYEGVSRELFGAIDELNQRLADQRYLTGSTLTEADWRLFTTMVRFDAIYVGLFKLDQHQLSEYPHLLAYVRDLYQHKNVATLVDLEYTKLHYYGSFLSLNPTGIVPLKMTYDFRQPHGREALSKGPKLVAA
jgi:putative glutathione S-transferase